MQSIPLRFLRAPFILAAFVFLPACDSSLKTELASLKTENATLRKEATALTVQIATLTANIDKLEAFRKADQTQIGARDTRIESLEKKQADAFIESGSLKDKIFTLQNELSTKQRELIGKVAQIDAIEAAQKAEREKTARIAEEEQRRASITVQLGVTMQSGDTKAVTNTKVYLTRKTLNELFPYTVSDSEGKPQSASHVWTTGVGQFAILYRHRNVETPAMITRMVTESSVQIASTDFNGRASFEALEPGEYVVLCVTPMGNGAVFEKRVKAAGKTSVVALSNDDILPLY